MHSHSIWFAVAAVGSFWAHTATITLLAMTHRLIHQKIVFKRRSRSYAGWGEESVVDGTAR